MSHTELSVERDELTDETREITRDELSAEWRDWRWQLRNAARSPRALEERGYVSARDARDLESLTQRFKTLITPYYLSLIDRGDPRCPIRLQSIPLVEELSLTEGERGDPIGDKANAPTPMLVHRYPDRALLFPTYECPMFCRYCFRKEALNEAPIRLHRDLDESLRYLRAHPEIEEVILSGGDPLMVSTSRLRSILDALAEVGIKRIRVHSRAPITLPQRLDAELIEALSPQRLGTPVTLITHANHPRELTELVKERLGSLKREGVTLLNQAVLLRGVNDHVDTLRALCKRLGDLGVTPYYLHHPDLTVGTQHLRVTIDRGLELTRALRGALSGYLIPRYVIEIPGGYGKVELDSYATRRGETRGQWWLRSPLNGVEHLYHDLAVSHQAHPKTSRAAPSEIDDLAVTHASLAHCGSSPQDEESALRASDSL